MIEITSYIVSVSYRRFHFEDGESALAFAETAARSMQHEKGYGNEISITIVTESREEK